jgi:hypothetical protein
MAKLLKREGLTVSNTLFRNAGITDGTAVFTYYEMMALVLKYSRRYRPIVSLPYSFGMLQGFVMERLPLNPLTLTRAQECCSI